MEFQPANLNNILSLNEHMTNIVELLPEVDQNGRLVTARTRNSDVVSQSSLRNPLI